MKKVIFLFVFLMLAGGVLAMSDPIGVKSEVGNEVKIYVYPSEVGPILNMKKGIVDENGIFERIFLDLNVENYKLRILVIDSDGDKIRDDRIEGLFDINGSVSIDCVPSVCEVTDEVFKEVEEVVNETVVNEVVIDSDGDKGFTGKVISVKEGGSLNWIYSVGGLVVLFLLAVFVVGMTRRGKSKGDVLDGDEKELRYMERKVRETEDKIKSIKDRKMRQGRLLEAREKLAKEEKELEELEAGGDKEKVVESVEDIARRIRG